MFVQSEKFVEEHGGSSTDISVLGQESNNTTWKLSKMNLAIRNIEGDVRWNGEGSFLRDEFPDLKADFILANPPFNTSDWGGQLLRDDVRWKYGAPPVRNANYAWIQHFIHHLSNLGTAGFVLANGSLSAGGVEGKIRKAIIEADLVDCIVSLPGQLFYSTPIPVSLWFISRNRSNRSGLTLFIDARGIGKMADRTHRLLTDADIELVAGTYRAWCGSADAGTYEDIAGFCKNASADGIRGHGYVLTPGRYVGVGEAEDDGELFEEKMARLVAELGERQAEARGLDAAISRNLQELGHGEWVD
jgi:type I restriction enzyme M protein